KLEDAGYTVGSDGVRSGPQGRLEFTFVFDQGVDAVAKSVKLWADDLEQIGIKLNLKGTDRNTYVALGQDPNEYDIYVSNWGTMEDPMNYWVPDFGSSSCETPGTSNHSCINDPTIDQLAIDIIRTTDKTAQLAKLYEMQEYVHEELPALFVWVENQNYAVSDKWDGWKLLPSINNSFLSPGSLSSVYQVEK
ncbi:MAG: hypothetical protein JW862_01555, partial [Anaerolineales bacterium]|nr:hypothetical protein [Anaerolineales bacterium]